MCLARSTSLSVVAKSVVANSADPKIQSHIDNSSIGPVYFKASANSYTVGAACNRDKCGKCPHVSGTDSTNTPTWLALAI